MFAKTLKFIVIKSTIKPKKNIVRVKCLFLYNIDTIQNSKNILPEFSNFYIDIMAFVAYDILGAF